MSQALELLRELKAQGLVTDLDLHFATLIGRLAADQRPELLLAAAFTSYRTGAGDVCLPLAEWSGRMVGGPEGRIRLPDSATWRRLLLETAVVGSPGDYRPLILDTAGRLYLQRYWAYEQQLADLLLARSRAEVATVDPERLRLGLGQLFPPQPVLGTDWQKVAAAVAVQKRFSVISGGPGTGKTSTVVRILALLQQQAGERPLVIALAAPTGKAAARLQESIQQARAHLPVAPGLLATIPAQAMTMHRLMGSRQDSVQFRHDADNPLPVDVLVIDEASMVDVALMSKVVAALPAEARLILLGDRNQLASVEAGAVLGDICGDDPGFSADFQQQLAWLTDQALAAETAAHQPLADAVVQLRHSYRFGGHSGIGRLAEAVNRGDGESARQLLEGEGPEREGPGDIRLLAGSSDPLAIAASAYSHYLKRIAAGAAAGEVFAAFDSFRVLCALRSGPAGVAELNQQIRQRLETVGLIDPGVAWYPGRPVLITRNDHNLKLYNGDVGILLAGEAGEMQVCFRTSDGVRRVSPARLPPHETAFAMTVHKSQGSEFARVLLILPGRDSPLLTRELIYTGLTRSRREFILSDAHGLLVPAIARRTRRASGLGEKLWGSK
ncbi:exodeoxyribonuclease V subunit alpha [Sedimenticola hydrogenitrophicus]|uniref:exodeoxyribonuclease V subunit alpha n=1 Tax=Sedimenticola hydrogenitrophicus TaxID=2967975 RepID=UPI0021A88C02|nr:exodeoxyribonuclease V subunit alpha [Sedimenticola hydrogenitrophicus]